MTFEGTEGRFISVLDWTLNRSRFSGRSSAPTIQLPDVNDHHGNFRSASGLGVRRLWRR